MSNHSQSVDLQRHHDMHCLGVKRLGSSMLIHHILFLDLPCSKGTPHAILFVIVARTHLTHPPRFDAMRPALVSHAPTASPFRLNVASRIQSVKRHRAPPARQARIPIGMSSCVRQLPGAHVSSNRHLFAVIEVMYKMIDHHARLQPAPRPILLELHPYTTPTTGLLPRH